MGFLHMLWDETFGGPTPDSGLNELRNFHSSPIITLRSPFWDLEKFVWGQSSVQSSVTTTASEFFWVMISALDR